ncbi:MAG: DUF2157 domain-containing protein [Proteobacteria bacterium]|nr:DUF2157 domain-containing protein [Pseudomonadota bacterium]MBU1744107.1 DUF2157 domain-containing protein [Pseudomonadota bacterium]
MNTIVLLTKLNRQGILTDQQLQALSDLHLKKRFSIHVELRACIYVGVLFILAGLGFTIKKYFTQLGDIAIIGFLSVCTLGAFSYCFLKGKAYSKEAVAPPNMVFDFVLFFGCTVYSLDVAYIETQFHILADLWVDYLLVSSALFFYFAYRFDNRLVLSLALSTLAAWFGFKMSPDFFHFQQYHRLYAIAYALLVFLTGSALYRHTIKRHFLDIYLNFAVHFLFVALVSGVIQYKVFSLYFPALIFCCALAAAYALHAKRFLYLLYAILYGYAGLSIVVVDILSGDLGVLFIYFIFSSIGVVGSLYVLSRRFREV